MTQHLDRMPSIRGEYFKALGTLRRKPKADTAIPAMALALTGVRTDPENLADYRRVCGFAKSDTLPITYPQVLAAPLQMHMLTKPEFPLPLLGLVHLRNHIVQERPLDAGGEYAVRFASGRASQTERGIEVDLVTTFADAQGAEIWRSVATVLYRGGKAKTDGKPRKMEKPAEDARVSTYLSFDAPEDIGRRYGRISGDLNPIHLRPWTAKLFGFPRHIAHGMWSMARCVAQLEGQLKADPRELMAQFRQPLLLPGRVALKYINDDGVIIFSLLNRNSAKTHLSGTLR